MLDEQLMTLYRHQCQLQAMGKSHTLGLVRLFAVADDRIEAPPRL